MENSDIEIIYISKNNKVIKNYIPYKKKYYLQDLINDLISHSVFSKKFFLNKSFGCFGKLINHDYEISENDRIEILDELIMSPNERRKHNFKKN